MFIRKIVRIKRLYCNKVSDNSLDLIAKTDIPDVKFLLNSKLLEKYDTDELFNKKFEFQGKFIINLDGMQFFHVDNIV